MAMAHTAQIYLYQKGKLFDSLPPPPPFIKLKQKQKRSLILSFIGFCYFLLSALPSHDPDEINKDIKSVDDWIQKNKDEL